MAIRWLRPSSLLLIAALMLGCVTKAPPTVQSFTMCDTKAKRVIVTPTSSPMVIRSPNYEKGVYPNDLKCLFILEALENQPVILTFEFNTFELEYSPICEFDYLCVKSVKFCGVWAKHQVFREILRGPDESTMSFYTDNIRGFSGFEIIVTTRPVVENDVVLEPIGIGSHPTTLSYVNVTYHPEMFRVDKCHHLPELYLPDSLLKRPTKQPTKTVLKPSSATDDINTMDCECECPLPHNYYENPNVGEDSGF